MKSTTKDVSMTQSEETTTTESGALSLVASMLPLLVVTSLLFASFAANL